MYLNGQSPATPLRESVGSGKVSLAPEAGAALGKALTAQLDQADAWLERITQLARPVPLGANPVGTGMSGKFERLASGGQVSFAAVVTAYREVLRQTHETVTGAMRDFTETDQAKRDVLRRIHH